MSEIEEDPWAAALAEQAEASEGSADEEDPWAAALNEQAESEAQAATPSAGMSSTYLEKKIRLIWTW